MKLLYTPENISELKENQIFVFGSNMAGFHYGGAAKFAFDKFGAVWGQGLGIAGQTYAFPTLHRASTETGKNDMELLNDDELEAQFKILFIKIEENPDKEFLLTKIGTGIAGIPIQIMNELFNRSYNEAVHTNLIYPIEFEKIKI